MKYEISVAHPHVSEEERRFRQYARHDYELKSLLDHELSQAGINQLIGGSVIELCAGDAPLAEHMRRRGFVDITCVDLNIPAEPLADSKWLYWNLAELGLCLISSIPLPEFVEEHRGKYDVVLMTNADMQSVDPQKVEEAVCAFFLRDGGLIFHAGCY